MGTEPRGVLAARLGFPRNLQLQGFSRQGVINQLEYDSHSADEVAVAVDSITIDYNAQAAKSAAQ